MVKPAQVLFCPRSDSSVLDDGLAHVPTQHPNTRGIYNEESLYTTRCRSNRSIKTLALLLCICPACHRVCRRTGIKRTSSRLATDQDGAKSFLHADRATAKCSALYRQSDRTIAGHIRR